MIFAIKPTFGEIIPEQCKYLQKTNLFSITLTKKSSGTWTQLNFKEDKFKADKKEDNADPNASLMNMMKKMYYYKFLRSLINAGENVGTIAA